MTPGSRRREQGQASVELALVLPVLLAAAFVVAQVGVVVKDYVLVAHAAREALRAAVVDPTNAAATRAVDRAVAGPIGLRRDRVAVHVDRRADRVTVGVSYRHALNVPIFGTKIRDFSTKMQVTGQVED